MSIFSALFNRKIIIGIHGLANKPQEKLWEKWWIQSIKEGLAGIGHPETSFKFKSVYWADILYDHPQDMKVENRKSPFYLNEPYIPGDPKAYENHKPSKIKKKLLDIVDSRIDKVFFKEQGLIDFDKIADRFMRNIYQDLYFYYNSESPVQKYKGQPARDVICARLTSVLRKYRNRQILLIGHSMGTIISYDVLIKNESSIKVHSLVTIGSPLGLPVIIKKIYLELGKDYRNEKQAPTPENIRYKWNNFSDLDDIVALVYKLANDYKKNSHGVGPEDGTVYNNYEFEGKRNPHKLYGYLRAPEVAQVIYDFCKGERAGVLSALKKRLFSFKSSVQSK